MMSNTQLLLHICTRTHVIVDAYSQAVFVDDKGSLNGPGFNIQGSIQTLNAKANKDSAILWGPAIGTVSCFMPCLRAVQLLQSCHVMEGMCQGCIQAHLCCVNTSSQVIQHDD